MKLGCKCGHTIADQTDYLPYKGRILPDLHDEEFFVWIVEQTQGYLNAVREGRAGPWLLERGFKQDYIDLGLTNTEVLHDLISTKFLGFKRDMYECGACGRIHIEARESNRFISYAPDNGVTNAILADSPADQG